MCSVSVSQPRYLEVDYTHEAVTLRCSFSLSGCPQERPTSLWFRYGTHQPEQLGDQERFKVTEDLQQNQVSLTVSKVNFSDSAIYICGIAFPSSSDPRAKQTGGGTELVVRGLSSLIPGFIAFLPARYYIYAEVLENLLSEYPSQGG